MRIVLKGKAGYIIGGLLIISVVHVAALHGATAVEYCNYGDTLYSQGNHAQALQYYSYAAKLDSNMWEAYKGIGSCYYQQGDYQNALTYVEYGCKLNPGNLDLTVFKADIMTKLGGEGAGASAEGSTQISGGMSEMHPLRSAVGDVGAGLGRFVFGITYGMRHISDDKYDKDNSSRRKYAEWNGEYEGIELIDVTGDVDRMAAVFCFAGGVRVGRRFIVGVDLSYSSVKIIEGSIEEVHSDPFVYHGLTGTDWSTNISLLTVVPILSFTVRNGPPALVVEGGLGMAKGGMSDQYRCWYEDGEYSARGEVGSTGMCFLMRAKALLPIGRFFFVDAGLSFLRTFTGAWKGTNSFEGDTEGYGWAAGWGGSNYDGVMMEKTVEGDYMMMFAPNERVEAMKEFGWEEARFDFGGISGQIGVGCRF